MPPVAVYVGFDGSPPPKPLDDPAVEVTAVVAVEELPSGADCAVCPAADGWPEVVERLRARGVPVVLVDETADPSTAVEASRLGVEYAPADELADRGETLADRVRATAPAPAPSTDGGVLPAGGPSPAVQRSPWFRAVFDHPTSFVGLLDAEGRVLGVNRTAAERIDIDPADAAGVPFWDAPWWSPDDDLRERMRRRVERATAGERVPFEDAYYDGDERREVTAALEPVEDDGEVAGVVAGGHDITQLRRNAEAMRALADVAASDASLSDAVDRLLAVGAEYLGADVGFRTSVEETDERRFRAVESYGDDRLVPDGAAFEPESYYASAARRDGRLAVVEPSEDSIGSGEGPTVDWYLGSATRVDGEVCGSVCFAGVGDRERPFSDAERAFIETLSEWVSAELQRLRDRERAETADRRFERTLDRVSDAVFAVDDDWTFTYVNELAGRFLDRDPDALVGENVWEAFPDAVTDDYYDRYHEAMRTQEPVRFEEFYEPLGLWTEVSAYPDEDGLTVFFDDVTERKRRQRGYETLIETSRELLAAETRQDVVETVRRTVVEEFGYAYCALRLYDEDAEALVAVDTSASVPDAPADRPVYEVGEGLPGRAFERGEPVHEPDHEAAGIHVGIPAVDGSFTVPMGEVGTISVGAAEPDAFDATDRRLLELLAVSAESALARTDRGRTLQRYRAVLEQTGELAFALDPDGYITLVTAALADRWDKDPEEIVGDHVLAYVDREFVEAVTAELAAADGTVTVEGTAIDIAADFAAEVQVSPLPGGRTQEGVVGIVRDISELAATRSDLERERDRLSHLFEELPDPVMEVRVEDGVHVVRNVNPAFEATFLADGESAAGVPVVDVVERPGGDERPFSIDHGGGIIEHEIERMTTDGLRTFALRAVPFETGGERRVFAIYVDITDQIERQRRLEMLHRVLRHNLRNELTVIDGNAAMLEESADDERTTTLVDGIRSAAGELATLSDASNAIQRTISTTPSELSAEPVADIVDGVLAAYEDIAVVHGAPAGTRVDAGEHVRRALDELVDNAVRHGEPPVRVATSADDETVTVRVTDDGDGVPADEQRVLAGNTEITQLTHGRGLGLWLARYVATSLGGDIAFEDGGQTALLRLPRLD